MELARLEPAEVAAVVDHWRAAPSQLVEREGIALLEIDGLTMLSVRSLPESRLHNHAYGVASAADVERVDAFYRECSSPYVLSTGPGTDLDAVLEQHGYTRGYAWMKFGRDLAPLVAETTLRVSEIGEEAGAAFGEIIATAFGMPAWTADWFARMPGRADWVCFLSYADRTPAGAGALFVAGDVGWLGLGATLPAFRGRGGQAALIAARIDAARARGCTALATETGVRVEGRAAGSYRNLLRAGFVEVTARDNWVPPSPGGTRP
jgi:GNAT superfamily N-acetyltransferase